jgi:dienelactone hydrolase
MEQRALTTYEDATGFIVDWMITGFFPSGTGGSREPDLYEAKVSRFWTHDYLAPYGGAAAIRDLPPPRGLCPVEWLPVRAEPHTPQLWLQPLLRTHPALARAFPGEAKWDHQWYALALVESDREQAAELRLCGNDGCQVWWNGTMLLSEHAWHKLAYDLHVLPVRLKKGRNALLLKLDRYGLVARLTAPDGKKLPGKVTALSAAEPPPTPPGTVEQLRRYAATLQVKMPCDAKNAAAQARWRKGALAHYRACLGPFPPLPAKLPKKLDPVETVARNGYTRFRYHLPREAGSLLPVHVLVPDAARRNGRTVICPHGHGQDDKVVAGIQPPAKPYGNWCGPCTANYAELLAQAGFVTATWSERAVSHERNDTPPGDPCNHAAFCAMAMGMTLPGLHLFDLHGVADFVATLPDVDRKRMGLTGLSGGGTLTCLGAAYDERFAAAAIFCGLYSYQDYATSGGCGMQVVPGLYPTLDTGELLCLAAPRPLLLAQGRRDVGFNIFRLQRFAREARQAYRALGHEDRVEVCLYDLAHQVNIEAAIDFFTRRL